MNRRQVLALGSCVGSSSIAGCSDFFDDDEKEYATLQGLGVWNDVPEPITLEVRIEREDTDEVVYEHPYKLDGNESFYTDCVWPADAPLKVNGRWQEDDEWTSVTTTDYENCVAFTLKFVSTIFGTGVDLFDYGGDQECPHPGRAATCHLDVGDEDQS